MGSTLSLPTISLGDQEDIFLEPDKKGEIKWTIHPGQDLSKIILGDKTRTLKLYGDGPVQLDLLRLPTGFVHLWIETDSIVDLNDMKLPKGLHHLKLVPVITNLEYISFPEEISVYINITDECLDRLDGFYISPIRLHYIYLFSDTSSTWFHVVVLASRSNRCLCKECNPLDMGLDRRRKLINASNRTCTKALFKTKEHPYSLQAWCVRTSYLLGGVAWEDVDSALYKK